MAGPGGVEVGRISIRVVPDTDNFRRELERDLKAIQKSVSLKIPVELDMKGTLTQLAKIKAALSGLGGGKVSVGGGMEESLRRTSVQAKTLTGLLSKLSGGVKGLGNDGKSAFDGIRLRAMLATDAVKGFGKGIAEARNTKIDDMVSAKFLKNLSSGKKAMDSFLDPTKINRFKAGWAGFGPTVSASAKAAGNGLLNMGKHIGNIDLNFKKTRKSASVFFSSITKGLSGLGEGLFKPLTMITGSLDSSSRAAMIFKLILAGIGPILGIIAGLLAGLPSLIAAAGVAVGVIALGMDGIKNAWKTFTDGIEPVKKAVSETFEKGLTPQFKQWSQILNGMIPQLQKVASGLTTMLQGFTNAISSKQGLADINIILGNTATFFAQLKGPLQSFTEGFLAFAREGSKSFDLLVGVFQRFADSFKALTTSAGFANQMRKALEGLAKVVDALLQGFLKLFSAGMDAMGQLGGPLANAINSVVDAIVAALPSLVEFAKLILNVITTLADQLTPVFQQLAPVFAEFFKNIGDLLIPVIKAIVPPLAELIKFVIQLFNAFSPLFPVITQIVQILGDLLTRVLKAMQPVLPVIADAMKAVADVISGALKDAMPVLQELAESIGTAIADAVKALAPLLPGLIKSFLDLVVALVPILPMLAELIGKLLPPAIELFAAIAKPILEAAKTLTDFLMPAIKWVIDLLGDIIKWLLEFGKKVAEAGGHVLQWFADLPGKIWEFVKNIPKAFTDLGADIIHGIWEGIKSAMGWLKDRWNDFIDWLPGSFADGLKINSPSRVFMKMGGYLMSGLQKGIDGGRPDVMNAMNDVTAGLTNMGVTAVNGQLATDGTIAFAGDTIGDHVEAALSGWTVQQNKQGTFSLARSAERDNRFRR